MAHSHTRMATDQARRYMNLVSKHWGHRFQVTPSEQGSAVDFGDSRCVFTVHDDALGIRVEGPADQLGMLEEVVLEHLQRFAPAGTTLAATWQRDGT